MRPRPNQYRGLDGARHTAPPEHEQDTFDLSDLHEPWSWTPVDDEDEDPEEDL